MKFDKDKHHCRSIRLKHYDYTNQGAYFVTICAWNRECLFGKILNGEVVMNEFGQVVKKEWINTGKLRPNVELDKYVVMPNHFHGVLIINGRGMARHAPTQEFANPIAQSLSSIIGSFKSAASKQINRSRNTPGYPVWQRNYYDRVIRNEKEINSIREYIMNNPLKWDLDENNQVNIDKKRNRGGKAVPYPILEK